jgi:hypothetical protein
MPGMTVKQVRDYSIAGAETKNAKRPLVGGLSRQGEAGVQPASTH